MDVGSSLPSVAEASEAVEPGEGAFYHPPVAAQAGAVGCAASGDDGQDAAGTDLVPVEVVVVAAVCEDGVRLAAGSAHAPRTGGMASSSGRSWVTSLRLPPVRMTASGVPCPSVIRWCLDPARPRSTGDGPVSCPLLAP